MSRSPAPRRRATLASLAAELKVSRTTISNAYNRPDQLSPDLRERVLATAKRLGYPGPDPVARSLRTRKAGAGGVAGLNHHTPAKELFRGSGGAGLRRRTSRVVRGGGAGAAAGGGRAEPQRRG